jgi:hypothetical protein
MRETGTAPASSTWGTGWEASGEAGIAKEVVGGVARAARGAEVEARVISVAVVQMLKPELSGLCVAW